MADQIFADGPIATPASYEVPGSAAIVPIAVQALLNGAGASGDYVPTLIFRSQAGHVIARVPTSTTVTAGDDAEVSWFPGVKSGGGLPTVTPANSFVSQATQTAKVIPTGVATTIGMDLFTQAQGWAPGLFVTGTLPSGTLTFAAFGTAVITLIVDWPAAAYDRYIELTVANAKLAEELKSPRFRVSATPDGDTMTLSAILSGGPSGTPTTVTATAFQASGVNRSVSATYYAQQINTHVTVS